MDVKHGLSCKKIFQKYKPLKYVRTVKSVSYTHLDVYKRQEDDITEKNVEKLLYKIKINIKNYSLWKIYLVLIIINLFSINLLILINVM